MVCLGRASASAYAIDSDKHEVGINTEIREEVQERAQPLYGVNVGNSKTTSGIQQQS